MKRNEVEARLQGRDLGRYMCLDPIERYNERAEHCGRSGRRAAVAAKMASLAEVKVEMSTLRRADVSCRKGKRGVSCGGQRSRDVKVTVDPSIKERGDVRWRDRDVGMGKDMGACSKWQQVLAVRRGKREGGTILGAHGGAVTREGENCVRQQVVSRRRVGVVE